MFPLPYALMLHFISIYLKGGFGRREATLPPDIRDQGPGRGNDRLCREAKGQLEGRVNQGQTARLTLPKNK